MNASLTAQNYRQGFLVDDELMAGVSEVPDSPGLFMAYVLRHTTGEYLGNARYETLEAALEALARIPRPWAFESTSGCDGSRCAPGKCKGAGCKIFRPVSPDSSSPGNPPCSS